MVESNDMWTHSMKCLQIIMSIRSCLEPSSSKGLVERSITCGRSSSTKKLKYTLDSFHAWRTIIVPCALRITKLFFPVTPVLVIQPPVCSCAAWVIVVSVEPETQVSLQHKLGFLVGHLCGGNKIFLLLANVSCPPRTHHKLLVVLFVKDKCFLAWRHPIAIMTRKLWMGFSSVTVWIMYEHPS